MSNLGKKGKDYLHGDEKAELVMEALRKAAPFKDTLAVDDQLYAAFREKNARINNIACVLFVAGMVCGYLVPWGVRGSFSGWDIGVMFGLATGLATFWILAACLTLGGFDRLKEFMTFYSAKYEINAKVIFLGIYVPIIAGGVVSAWFAYFSS